MIPSYQQHPFLPTINSINELASKYNTLYNTLSSQKPSLTSNLFAAQDRHTQQCFHQWLVTVPLAGNILCYIAQWLGITAPASFQDKTLHDHIIKLSYDITNITKTLNEHSNNLSSVVFDSEEELSINTILENRKHDFLKHCEATLPLSALNTHSKQNITYYMVRLFQDHYQQQVINAVESEDAQNLAAACDEILSKIQEIKQTVCPIEKGTDAADLESQAVLDRLKDLFINIKQTLKEPLKLSDTNVGTSIETSHIKQKILQLHDQWLEDLKQVLKLCNSAIAAYRNRSSAFIYEKQKVGEYIQAMLQHYGVTLPSTESYIPALLKSLSANLCTHQQTETAFTQQAPVTEQLNSWITQINSTPYNLLSALLQTQKKPPNPN